MTLSANPKTFNVRRVALPARHGEREFSLVEIVPSTRKRSLEDDPALEETKVRQSLKRQRCNDERACAGDHPFGMTKDKLRSVLRGLHHSNRCSGCSNPLCQSIQRFLQTVKAHKKDHPVCACRACKMWAWIVVHHSSLCQEGDCSVPDCRHSHLVGKRLKEAETTCSLVSKKV